MIVREVKVEDPAELFGVPVPRFTVSISLDGGHRGWFPVLPKVAKFAVSLVTAGNGLVFLPVSAGQEGDVLHAVFSIVLPGRGPVGEARVEAREDEAIVNIIFFPDQF